MLRATWISAIWTVWEYIFPDMVSEVPGFYARGQGSCAGDAFPAGGGGGSGGGKERSYRYYFRDSITFNDSWFYETRNCIIKSPRVRAYISICTPRSTTERTP